MAWRGWLLEEGGIEERVDAGWDGEGKNGRG